VELHVEVLSGELLDPREGFGPIPTRVEVRTDPLTGHTSRLVSGGRLMPKMDFDLKQLAEETRKTCPFCPDRIGEQTPRFPERVVAGGRIRRGSALLFPNLNAYGRFSSVSVYSPALHHLPLREMTEELVTDNLLTQVEFVKAARIADPDAEWASINANHMVPSGSSLYHPHMQGLVDPLPTTQQRMLAETPPERFREYVETERRDGRRHLGRLGRVEWMASFAPLGPGELRGFLFGASSLAELDEAAVAELGRGIATTLALYAEMGFESFNLAVYGAPAGTAGYPLNLRMMCRSSPRPFYRSDSTYFERLHWEAAVDVWPEDVAEAAGDRFRR
jgi:galactose-1-phosphate uridylyltransferase